MIYTYGLFKKFSVLFFLIVFMPSYSFKTPRSRQFVISTTRAQILWHQMQELYSQCLKNSNHALMNQWCHPFWNSNRNELVRIIHNSHAVNFLKEGVIRGTMVRELWSTPQLFEEVYLKSCLSSFTKNILQHASDTNFGHLPRSSPQCNCSTNTLGHLFYLAKIMEYASGGGKQSININTVVEIGGGYGNLARLFKQILPDATLILIDLPEMVALQWFFLQCTLPNARVVFHSDSHQAIVPGAINLIPLSLLNDFSFKADVFVSTFALSECTEKFHEYVADKKFFNASLCYIAGQLDGWNECNFEKHSLLFRSVHHLYSQIICHPFHVFSSQPQSYELIARR
jgi:hypothetical protein